MAHSTLEEILLKLDKVPCCKRLYPERIYALQILTNSRLDERVDSEIIEILKTITDYNSISFKFKFIKETMLKQKHTIPATWVEQFMSDFITFGLREAIAYFHTYQFNQDSSSLIESSVNLYHDMANLFLINENQILKSDNQNIKSLVVIREILGEGIPQGI